MFGKQYDKAKFYSENDTLTGIYNRRYVEVFFPKIKAIANQNGQGFALLLLDVNYFKLINDLYGHHTGDECLIHIAHQLKNSVKKRDIVARWGGDEFIILTQNIKDNENLDETIERKHHNLKQISSNNLEISVSIGTASYPDKGATLDQLVKIADKNMYLLKRDRGTGTLSYIPSKIEDQKTS